MQCALSREAGSQQKFINRLFSKNTGSCKPEMGRIGAETCPVLVSQPPGLRFNANCFQGSDVSSSERQL